MPNSISVDFRTRLAGHDIDLDPTTFADSIAPELVETRGLRAGLAAVRHGLPPLTLEVEGEAMALTPSAEGLIVRHGRDADGVVVALDQQAFSDFVQDAASAFGLQFTGRAKVVHGTTDDFVGWEPIVRDLIDGRPVYEPGSIDLRDRDGNHLDLHRSFRIDDDPADIGHFLAEAGYLHLQGVFTEAEMAAVAAEQDAAMARATRDDGMSWWARTEDGWYPCRILGFNHLSPTLRELLKSDRFATLGTLTSDDWVLRDPDTTDAAEGLYKKIGVLEGPSDVSWHKDCSMGGHSRGCCGLTVGVSITGAGPQNGELGAVAGSHRANVSPLGTVGVDLPKVPLPTATGDITIHCSCTLHMSRPPVSAERRVAYTGFNLAPRAGDLIAERSLAEVRSERAALSDQSRRSEKTGKNSVRSADFDL